jgi:nucleoside-triphosphatase
MTAPRQSSSPQRIFLTGEPGCGKTTVVNNTADLLVSAGLRIGGMLTNEVREKGTRVGFHVEDVATHERGVLAELGRNEGPRVGKYHVNINDLERIGAGAIRTAIEMADVVIVDELGPMELHSRFFIEWVRSALSSPKHVLGTIHRRATNPLVLEVKTNPRFTIIEVTAENRGNLPAEIAQRIIGTI